MAKRFAVLAAMLAVVLATAVPAMAQGEGTREELASATSPGPAQERTATFDFELEVEGESPEGAAFFGFVPAEGGISARLADPDGDGLYTGSADVPRFPPGPGPPDAEPVSLPVQIVQRQPGAYHSRDTVIRDFGAVPADDRTFSASVSFGGSPDEPDPDDAVTVTFELTVEGEVPEGRSLGVDTGIQDVAQPVFCANADFSSLPRCEDGETYSDTFEWFEGSSLPYEYDVFDYDFGGVVETFAAGERTFTGDETIRATYRPGDPGNQVTIVEATGTLEKPEATSYQYGTHAIADEASDVFYALRSGTENLDGYVGERVTLFGAPVPGYEAGQVEGGPTLLDVYKVEPEDGEPTEETVTVAFELDVAGEPPADATFFGYLGYEPIPFRLSDPDGDGTYTGSTPEDLVPTGDTQPALIVQGTGTRESQVVGTAPGEPVATIKDFGEVTFEEDTTLEASVAFGGSGGGSGGGDTGAGGLLGSAGDAVRTILPDTGGAALAVLGAGALLVVGGFFVRRTFR